MAEIDSLSEDCPVFDCQHTICATCLMQAEDSTVDEVRRCPKCVATPATPGNGSSSSKAAVQWSAKIEALIHNLTDEQTSEQSGEKMPVVKRYSLLQPPLFLCPSRSYRMLIHYSVIFSQWTGMLNLIAKALTHYGFRYQRLDGQSSLQQRDIAIQRFNDDSTYTIMLASIGSAGEG